MLKPSYRLMLAGEEDAVAAVARAAFENDPLVNETIDLGLREAFTNATWRPRYWLAEVDGELVGFGGWNWTWINYDVACFSWAGVLEAHQGKGIGRGLVEVRIADIKQTNSGISLVLVNTWNPAMYRRYGFETIGVHDFRSGKGEHLMRLSLTPREHKL